MARNFTLVEVSVQDSQSKHLMANLFNSLTWAKLRFLRRYLLNSFEISQDATPWRNMIFLRIIAIISLMKSYISWQGLISHLSSLDYQMKYSTLQWDKWSSQWLIKCSNPLWMQVASLLYFLNSSKGKITLSRFSITNPNKANSWDKGLFSQMERTIKRLWII